MEFPEAEHINLLESQVFRELSQRPELLRQRHNEQRKLIVIDEVQRLLTGSMPAILTSDTPWKIWKPTRACISRRRSATKAMSDRSKPTRAFSTSLAYPTARSDAGVPPRTVREHYRLLEDTLLGFQLKPYRKAKKRKPVATSKFYMFDTGLAHYLMRRRSALPGSREYGDALEHLIVLECRAWLSYNRRQDLAMTFWHTHSRHEVDLLIGDRIAIEIKSAENIGNHHLAGIRALAEEIEFDRKIVVGSERLPRRTDDGIEILPAEEFLRQLWVGEIVTGAV